MARQLPLPKREDLPETVLFHRPDFAEPRYVLQIPNSSRTDSQTFVIDLELESHRQWLSALPRERLLRDQLDLSEHVAYSTATGHFQEIKDLDAPTYAQELLAPLHNSTTSIYDRLSGSINKPVRLVNERSLQGMFTPFRASVLGVNQRGERRGTTR